jgi:hypothetical protein
MESVVKSTPTEDLFGPDTHTDTRAEALADGVLIDLSAVAPDVCRQHFKYPVACTAAVWGIIERAVANKTHANDVNGVIHDILFMSIATGTEIDPSTRRFSVIIRGAGPTDTCELTIVCGPGDDAEPVLTIMLPDED